MDIFKNSWGKTLIGRDFVNLGFHMFTMDQKLSEYEDNGEPVIRMTLGKSDRPLSPEVKAAMNHALEDPSQYLRVDSEGNEKFRSTVATAYSRMFDTKINIKNVIVGSQGTSSLYRDIFTLLLQDGGEVLLPRPGYILYEAAAALMKDICKADICIKYYDIDLKTNRIDMQSFRDHFNAEKTRIVVMNSPGNPTGNLVTYKEWEDIIDIVNQGKRAVLISDQVYGNIVFNGLPYPSILDTRLNSRIKIPFVVTDSMSKGYEMYTFRVGFAIVPDELVSPIITFQRNFSLTPVTVSQFGAIQAILQPERVNSLRKSYEERNNYAVSVLKNIKSIELLESEGGFYFVINCAKYMKAHGISSDLELAMKLAASTNPHVGTTPSSDFGAPGWLRMSYSPNEFCRGIDLIADFFKK